MAHAQDVAPVERRVASNVSLETVYLGGLAVVLAGYAIAGKTFAYLGLPPLYIGEITLISGLFVVMRSKSSIGAFASPANLLLGVLILWGLTRTLPFIGVYGVDALRDSVLINYGLFSFIVTALILKEPDRLVLVIKFLRKMTMVLIPLAPLILLSSDDALQNWSPDSGGSLFYVKPGTTAVHLGAAALLVLFGFRRANFMWLTLLFAGIGVAASQNRGGMLSILVMLTFASIASNRGKQFAGLVVVAVAVLGVAYMLDLSIPTNRTRDISVVQVVDNFFSIFGGGNADQDGTKMWRLQWWNSIVNYTIHGPYFWAGKGFGINLAISDGIASGTEIGDVPMLRNPHSSHYDMLARTGVVGLTLWIATLGFWALLLVHNIIRSRLRGDTEWTLMFTLILCYGVGLVIDSSFDVTLEGPMSGIWFWCIFGAGAAATMIYKWSLENPGQNPVDWTQLRSG